MNLDELNNNGIVSIHFDAIDKPLDVKKLSFLNLVFAGDGQYIVICSKFGASFEKVDSIKYRNLLLRKYEFDWSFQPFIERAPKEMFEQILECFKYIVGKTNDELLIIIYYDTIEKTHIMDIVKLQLVTGASVKYAYNKKYEMDDRYIKYLEIHSHNTMAAGFSGTDNQDESNRTMYYCGVIGKIDGDSNIFNVDQKFRIWTGTKFQLIPPSEVFEGLELPKVEVIDEYKTTLDRILIVSKIAKDQKARPIIHRSFSIDTIQSNTPQAFTPPGFKAFDPYEDKEPSSEQLANMDDDELDQLGWIWDDEDKDTIQELMKEGRGNDNRLIPPN